MHLRDLKSRKIFEKRWNDFRKTVEAFSTKSGMVFEEKWKNFWNGVERFSETGGAFFVKEWSTFRASAQCTASGTLLFARLKVEEFSRKVEHFSQKVECFSGKSRRKFGKSGAFFAKRGLRFKKVEEFSIFDLNSHFEKVEKISSYI